MALIFRNIGLAIYEQTEWDKMTIAEQNQARADYNLFVAPDGIRQGSSWRQLSWTQALQESAPLSCNPLRMSSGTAVHMPSSP